MPGTPAAMAGSLVVGRPVSIRPMNRREKAPVTGQPLEGAKVTVRSYHDPLPATLTWDAQAGGGGECW